MRKEEFLKRLKNKLWKLSKAEREERLSFYSEMIDDQIEEGLSEKDAVRSVGSANAIAQEILEEAKEKKAEARAEKKPLSGTTVLLIILGFPLWFPLLAAAFAVAISLYAVLFSVAVSLWGVFISLVATGVCGVIISVAYFASGGASMGFVLLGAGLLLLGLSVFLFFSCKETTKWTLCLAKKAFISAKNRISGKESV